MSNKILFIADEEPTVDGMTAEDWARDVHMDDMIAEENRKEAAKHGVCMHCGADAEDGECGGYKCWIA